MCRLDFMMTMSGFEMQFAGKKQSMKSILVMVKIVDTIFIRFTSDAIVNRCSISGCCVFYELSYLLLISLFIMVIVSLCTSLSKFQHKTMMI